MNLEGGAASRATVVTTAERWLQVALLLAAVSVLPRLFHLDVPPLDRHDFRQTQTAITVQSYLDHGVKVLRHERPVFGPPWLVPFEFPLFQLLAFGVAKLGGLNVDLACRLTAVLCFYASAWILFALVRRWASPRVATLTLALYVFSPFSVIWSRAVLIDYGSVALALGYLHATLLWSLERRRGAWIWAMVLGVLGFLLKPTTMATVAVPVALALGWRVRRSWEASRTGGGQPLATLLIAGALAGVPFVAGLLWTRWADAIKAAQPATVALTSSALTTWNYGTWGQRAAWDSWAEILGRIVSTVLPVAFAVTPLLAIPFFRGADRRLRLVVLTALAGVIVPIAIFFNLYWVHDYYLIATTPALAVLGACGIAWLLDRPFPHPRPVGAITLALACLSTAPCWSYVAPTYQVSRDAPIARLGSLVARSTGPEDWVVVQGDDWNARILYSSHRRGFMIWEGRTDVRPLAARPELGALVCRECPPDLLALFPRRRLVGHEASFDVYRLWPATAAPR